MRCRRLVGQHADGSDGVRVRPTRDHVTVPNLDDRHETLELMNVEITASLARQATSGSQVDTKAAFVAGFAATAAQFLAGRKDPSPDLSLTIEAYIAYALAFAAAVSAYAVSRYRYVPEPRGLVRECLNLGKTETLARLIATRVDAFEVNRVRHRRKVAAWWLSVIALAVGLIASTSAMAYSQPAPSPSVQRVHLE